jgi:hypothetical protein
MITPAVVTHEPTSLAAVHDQCAAIEAWAEACQSVPELRDASNKLAAIDTYLERTSIEGRARTAAAMRRLEVRIGQLLGPAEKGRPSNGNVPREEHLPGNRRHDFRQMAEHEDVVEDVIADSTDEDPASRRKVTEAIRRQRQADTEVEPCFKGSVTLMKKRPASKVTDLGATQKAKQRSEDAEALRKLNEDAEAAGLDTNPETMRQRGEFHRLCRDLAALPKPSEFLVLHGERLTERHITQAERAYAWLDEFLLERGAAE